MPRASLFILLATLLPGPAFGGPLDQIYDDAELADVQPRYEKGWKENYAEVFTPVLSDEERARLDWVDFRMELRVEDSEPFAFMAGGGTVIASAASLKFLEDIALANTWLEKNGYESRSVADYLLMLRYWDEANGRPPKPLDALCIPADARDDTAVAERADRIFDTSAVFALLHEYGHVLYGHPGNRAVPPDVSRANEEAADAFALDVFSRVHEVPIGVTVLFFMMANLHENRADYGSDEEYQQTLAARTHPVSPERLQSLARHLSASAEAFGPGFQPGSKTTAVTVALLISQYALLLADTGIQGLSAQIGRTVRPEDLAPRASGRQLALPCGSPQASGQDFDGLFHGQIIAGSSKTSFNTDTVLRRDGDTVTGSYSFGAGFGRLEGTVDGSTLDYDWTLATDRGKGQITMEDGAYRGTWGMGDSATDFGTIELEREQ
jgi:hypothetical protein